MIAKYKVGDYVLRCNRHKNHRSFLKILDIEIRTARKKDGGELHYPTYKMMMLYTIESGIDYDVYNDVTFVSSHVIDTESVTRVIDPKEENNLQLPKVNTIYKMIGDYEKTPLVLILEATKERITYRSLDNDTILRTKYGYGFLHFYEEYHVPETP